VIGVAQWQSALYLDRMVPRQFFCFVGGEDEGYFEGPCWREAYPARKETTFIASSPTKTFPRGAQAGSPDRTWPARAVKGSRLCFS
jgi:hypothetical protein